MNVWLHTPKSLKAGSGIATLYAYSKKRKELYDESKSDSINGALNVETIDRLKRLKEAKGKSE